MRTFAVGAALILAPLASAAAQTISGYVYDHRGDPRAGIVVAYNLSGNVQQDTTDVDGSYLLSFGASSVPDEGENPPAPIPTWGRVKAAFSNPAAKVASGSRTTILPDTLYFLGGATYWSNTHPLPPPQADATVDMALPPAVYTDIPTEGAIIINPVDYADYHNLLNAPVPPALVPNSLLWHPSRIQFRIPVDIQPEWNETQCQYIRQYLAWFESNMDVQGTYGMDSLFVFVARGSLGPTDVGWRIRYNPNGFSCNRLLESIGGEYFVKHSEVFLQFADAPNQWRMIHEFNHGLDGIIAHVDYPLYNGDGYSLMNMSAQEAVPPDKAYQKLAYQLQKLRLVDGKHDGSECFYCIRQ